MLLCLFKAGNIFCFLIGISSKKLESWLDEQDEDLNDLRAELKKERKQHENTLRVTAKSHKLFLRWTNPIKDWMITSSRLSGFMALLQCFNFLTRLFGWQEGHSACKQSCSSNLEGCSLVWTDIHREWLRRTARGRKREWGRNEKSA